jgi:integrase/recombinase XerD
MASTAEEIDGDFNARDTMTLNRFFAAYFAAHGQGGTNTKQRNLRRLFSWLEGSGAWRLPRCELN